MYLKELEIARNAAVLAGRAIMEVYESGGFGIEAKDDDSPLTLADKAANRIIVDILKKEFPDYAILSEEEQDDLILFCTFSLSLYPIGKFYKLIRYQFPKLSYGSPLSFL